MISASWAQGSYGQEFQSFLGEVNQLIQDPSASDAQKADLIIKRGKTLAWKKQYPESDSIFAIAWKQGIEGTENLYYYRGKTNYDHFFALKKKNALYFNSIERKKALELFQMALDNSDDEKKKDARERLQTLEKATLNDLYEMLGNNPKIPKNENNLSIAGDLIDYYVDHYPRAYPYEWKNRKDELNETVRNIYLSIAGAYKNLMNEKKEESYQFTVSGKKYQASKAKKFYALSMDYADKAQALDIYNLKVKNFISSLKNSYGQIESDKKSEQLVVQEQKFESSQQELSSVKGQLMREMKILDSLSKSKEELTAAVEAQKTELEKTAAEVEQYKDELGQSAILLENQKLISFITAFVAILILVLLIISVIGFKKLRRQNSIIEKNRNEIQIQHLEITDSIVYAKRIQAAIMPPMKLLKEQFKESFIFYEPKDVVAGDFYWMTPGKNGDATLIAAADCTGHGVPGAMVSVVCNSALNRSVKEFGLQKPGDILTKTRDLVIQEFERSDEVVRDGMDIALCSVKGRKLQYAGANNPLWIIRKGGEEVEIISAHKQGIGMAQNISSFPTHEVELKEGDTFYIFSDGFADQFGGERGKKLKAPNFRNLLLSIQEKNMDEQHEALVNYFFKWKASYDQVDDVCVIGVRV